MGFLAFLVLGLIAGAIARSLMKQPGGWLATLVGGVAGAVVGGWLGALIFRRPLGEFFSLYTWAMAIAGSCLVLFLWSLVRRRR